MNPMFGSWDEDPIRGFHRATPESADLFPLPRRCAQGFGNSRNIGAGRTCQADRSTDLRGFKVDAHTPFLADAFIRNTPFTYPSRAFEVCRDVHALKGLTEPPRGRPRHKRPKVKAKTTRKIRPKIPQEILSILHCQHIEASRHGSAERSWMFCARCGWSFDFQGDWATHSWWRNPT